MKEKASVNIKEAPQSPMGGDKERMKVPKRKYSSYEEAPAITVEEQFKHIVESARTDVVVRMIKQQIRSSQSPPPPPAVDTSAKQLHVSLEHCRTPAKSSCIREEADVAPSPLTPPLPKRMRLVIEDGTAPSPEGMQDVSPLLPPLSVQRAAQALFGEGAEETFFDAQDTSLIESGNGLNLDCLIDEIFVNDTNGEVRAADPLISASEEEGSGLASPEKVNIIEADPEHFIEEADPLLIPGQLETNETGCIDSSPQPDRLPSHSKAAEEAPETEADICLENIQRMERNQKDSHVSKANQEENHRTEKSIEAAAPCSCGTTIDSNLVKEPVLPVPHTNNEVLECSPNIIEVLLNEEAFHDDFSLTESQILDIEAKCTGSLQVESTHKENPSVVLPKPPSEAPDLRFTLPSAPRLDWMQKAVESRQRLRSITQEISRLNAMVLRARRTIWPRQNQEVEQQLAPTSTAGSKSSYSQPVTSQCRPHLIHDLSNEPEWNLS